MLDKILRPADIDLYQLVSDLTHYEMLRSRRYQRPLSVIVLVDSNDDEIFTGRCLDDLRQNIRRIDVFETSDFKSRVVHIICPETNLRGASELAARLKQYEQLQGALIGHATFPDDGSSIDVLLKTAHERSAENSAPGQHLGEA